MNENIFSGKAEVYMQCRPRYAQGVLDFIRRETALTPDSLIADIGAGTGIFTEQLMSLGCRVAAVEPNGDMRSRIAETAPGAEIISAPAEHTGLPDGSVSLITAAESFHWFQPDDFREECRRILRPGGKVMIVWNLTDKKSSLVCTLHKLNLDHCARYRELFSNGRSIESERFVEISQKFLKNYSSAIFKNDLSYNKSQFIGNRISSSYAPKSGGPEFDNYRTALEECFEQFSVSDEKYKVMSENYLTNSHREIYPNDLMFTKEQFIGNRISRSYAPKSGDPEFDNYCTALEEFFEQHQQNGVILIPNNTVCFIGMV